MIAGIILLLPVLMRAAYTDIRTGKIENRLILTALIMGVLLAYVTGGAERVLIGVKMAVIMTAVLFILFVAGGLGAGDIKLLAVIAVCFPEQCVTVAVAAFIVAGIMAFIRMIWRAVRRRRIYIRGETIHFSVPILIGFLAVMIHGTLTI